MGGTVELVDVLRDGRDAIIADGSSLLERSHLPHYDAERSMVRSRLDRLFDALLASLQTRDLAALVAYADELGRERFAGGFDLSEVQGAINGLEEATWRWILAEVEPARYAEALGLVSTALGVTKDALARTYVSLASRTHAPSLDLKRLFQGTDGV